jgi:hypothetical protein
MRHGVIWWMVTNILEELSVPISMTTVNINAIFYSETFITIHHNTQCYITKDRILNSSLEVVVMILVIVCNTIINDDEGTRTRKYIPAQLWPQGGRTLPQGYEQRHRDDDYIVSWFPRSPVAER